MFDLQSHTASGGLDQGARRTDGANHGEDTLRSGHPVGLRRSGRYLQRSTAERPRIDGDICRPRSSVQWPTISATTCGVFAIVTLQAVVAYTFRAQALRQVSEQDNCPRRLTRFPTRSRHYRRLKPVHRRLPRWRSTSAGQRPSDRGSTDERAAIARSACSRHWGPERAIVFGRRWTARPGRRLQTRKPRPPQAKTVRTIAVVRAAERASVVLRPRWCSVSTTAMCLIPTIGPLRRIRIRLRNAYTPAQLVTDRRDASPGAIRLDRPIRSIEDQRLHNAPRRARHWQDLLLHVLAQAFARRAIQVYASRRGPRIRRNHLHGRGGHSPALPCASWPDKPRKLSTATLADVLPSGPVTARGTDLRAT